MKRALPLLVIGVIVVGGVLFALRYHGTADLRKAVSAESKGDYKEALTRYAAAAGKIFPGTIVPDVNRSKVLSPAAWKEDLAKYSSWLSGPGTAKVEREKKDAVLGAIARNAPLVRAENFLSSDSAKPITAERFAGLWFGAFFARGVPVDSGHLPLATGSFQKGFSILKFSALTSYTYSVTLLDTSAERRTTFTVFPESSTFVLAAPGNHILICQSSYQPAPGQIWRSSPAIIPLAVPPTPSLLSFTIGTHVTRKAKGT